MKSLLFYIVLFAVAASAVAQDYPYQPFGLFRYCLFLRGDGPRDNVDGAGDQNGDGYDDFVSIINTGTGNQSLTTSYLFFGGQELDTIPDLKFTSRILGFSDFNGDGVTDFLTYIYDFENDWNTQNYGIIFGGDLDTLVDVELPIPPDERPHYYKSIGDVNDDGNEDLMLRQRYRNDSLDMSIYDYSILLCGANYDSFSTWHVATDSLHELTPSVMPYGFGNVDGGGGVDVVIQRHGDDHQGNHVQDLYIVHDFLTDEDPDTSDLLEHLHRDDYYSIGPKVLPDINGDGLDEIVVNMISWEANYIADFYIIFGSREHDNEPDFDFRDQEFYREYGPPSKVFNIGDVNADGYDDMSFCMRFANASWGYIFLGGPDMDETPDAMIVSPFEGTRYDSGLGYLIKGCGDVNGNGVDDIIVLSQPQYSEMNAALVMSLDEEFADINSQPRGEAGLLPTAYLYPPFPSPFNSTVRLDFALPTATEVNLSIVDITGRVVAEVVDGRFASGSYQRIWTNDVAGLYFVVLQTEGGRSVRKVVCLS